MSLFRHKTWLTSVSVHYTTLKWVNRQTDTITYIKWLDFSISIFYFFVKQQKLLHLFTHIILLSGALSHLPSSRGTNGPIGQGTALQVSTQAVYFLYLYTCNTIYLTSLHCGLSELHQHLGERSSVWTAHSR